MLEAKTISQNLKYFSFSDKRFETACELPDRYRQRPSDCFATNDKEKSECSSAAPMAAAALTASAAFWIASAALAPVAFARLLRYEQ